MEIAKIVWGTILANWPSAKWVKLPQPWIIEHFHVQHSTGGELSRLGFKLPRLRCKLLQPMSKLPRSGCKIPQSGIELPRLAFELPRLAFQLWQPKCDQNQCLISEIHIRIDKIWPIFADFLNTRYEISIEINEITMYIYDISIKSNKITIKLDGITTQINEIRFRFHADSTDKKIISILYWKYQ